MFGFEADAHQADEGWTDVTKEAAKTKSTCSGETVVRVGFPLETDCI